MRCFCMPSHFRYEMLTGSSPEPPFSHNKFLHLSFIFFIFILIFILESIRLSGFFSL